MPTRVGHHRARVGYRHIGTGEMYQNEAEVGAAVETFDRDHMFSP